MSAIAQIVPYDADVDVLQEGYFDADFRVMCDSLKGCCDGQLLEVFPEEIHNPYPIGVTLQCFELMKNATGALNRGIHAIVNNYLTDDRIQKVLSLPPRAIEVIRSVQHIPYKIGSWRPDILFPADDDKSFKICEINARFPFNAFFASHEKNNVLSKLSYLQNAPIMSIQELDAIPNIFKSLFNPKKSVGILKPNQGGWDVKLFQQSFTAQAKHDHPNESTSVRANFDHSSDIDLPSPPSLNVNEHSPSSSTDAISPRSSSRLARTTSLPQPPSTPKNYKDTFETVEAVFINPSDLRIDDVDGLLYSGTNGPYEQFAFECDQDYLLYKLDPRILDHILKKCVYINDIRTILISHDKRLLALLTDEDIMRSYVSEEDIKILQKNVIKTYVIGQSSSKIIEEANVYKDNWLMKPNGAGKGEGIVFGKECETVEEWSAELVEPSHANFILQPLIEQQTFDLVQQKGVKEMLVVGLLHNFNDQFLGPGIFRASLLSSPIVNVSGGNGIILSPCVISSRYPIVRKKGGGSGTLHVATGPGYGQTLSSSIPVPGGNHLTACETTKLHFAFPSTCCFSLTSVENSDIGGSKNLIYQDGEEADCDAILSTLISEGIVKVDVSNWNNDERLNDRLRDLASSIGIMNSHSSTESDVWDVRPGGGAVNTSSSPSNFTSSTSSNTNSNTDDIAATSGGGSSDPVGTNSPSSVLARSNSTNYYAASAAAPTNVSVKPARSTTAEEFPMHTDCSFEELPPRYMLLYVINEDHMNGGLTTLIDSTVLMRYLSKRSLAALHKYEYEMRVPPEFFKGEWTIKGRILSAGKLWRYRSDTIVRTSCNEEQIKALNELDALLDDPRIILTTNLTRGSLLLLDNSRWFHGRTQIFDKNRWLKRIRFHPKNYKSIEAPFEQVLTRSITFGISPPSSPIDESSSPFVIATATGAPTTLDEETTRRFCIADEGEGVFSRLSSATDLLLQITSDPLLVSNFEYYIRDQIRHIESLQYFMIDFKSRPLSVFRYTKMPSPVTISCIGAPFEYVVLQAAISVIVGNRTILLVRHSDIEIFSEIFAGYTLNVTVVSTVSASCQFSYNNNLAYDAKSNSIIINSIVPSINQLCLLEVQNPDFFINKYRQTNSNHFSSSRLNNSSSSSSSTSSSEDVFDEFDFLDADARCRFVNERLVYLTKEVKRRSKFYSSSSSTSSSSPLESFPIITGDDLGRHGDSILTSSHFNIAFATGGTTGAAKVVYRNTWEDQENGRYIAKGLMASGLSRDDIVINILSSGFWGGMHVFNLAMQLVGCSLLPMGSAFPFDQLVTFTRKLKPTAILAMPSLLLQFVEYLEVNRITDIHFSKVITGGEILFEAKKERIKEVLHVPASGFLSTGYTSNETGAIGFRCRYAPEGVFHIHENMQLVSTQQLPAHHPLPSPLASIADEGNAPGSLDTQSGPFLTSNLNRTLMPVLNYRIGDHGTIQQNHNCPCGRTLSTLTLKGRCDDRFRIGKVDLFVDEIAKAIAMVPDLGLNFTIHVKTCPTTSKDAMEIHVELKASVFMSSSGSGVIDSNLGDSIRSALIVALTQCCEEFSPDLWSPKSNGDAGGIIKEPLLVFYAAGTLPKNVRSGKIALFQDHRGKIP